VTDGTELVRVGYGNYVPRERVTAVLSPVPAPVQRLVRHAKDEKLVIDMTAGRRTRSVAIMDDGTVALLGLTTRELGKRGLPLTAGGVARRRKRAR
jgi:regulator of extracellular matrix RemA (YlzA/DUF370 family)